MSTSQIREETVRLLRQSCAGDESATARLFELLHPELRALAGRLMGDEREGHTLQATALVNEAWLRLGGGEAVEPKDRLHFLRLAARAMRRVLVDHARARRRLKRGAGEVPASLDDLSESELGAWERWEREHVDLIDLDEALERLEHKDVQLARVVELRFFSGMTLAETASALDVSEDAVRWSWRLAQAWLKRELDGGRER